MTMDATGACELDGLSPESFARLAEYITRELGIKMPESKLATVQSRLFRRVRDLGLNSVEEYGAYLFSSSNQAEREQFINAITTNKTDFFREPAHFDFLVRAALPELSRNLIPNSCRLLRVWSAGCSSGKEAYTLAMVLNEYASGRPGFDFTILGTDVSTRVLEQARNGIYTEADMVPVPVEFRRKYILRSRKTSERLVRIVPGLRRKSEFCQLNFMDQSYHVQGLFDIVFFRNVLIYFDRPTQEAVVNKICKSLAPRGYLFVGHSESLTGLQVPLRQVQTSIFRKIR